MMFKRGLWYPIAVAALAINVAGGIYASLTSEPIHAFVHGALAIGFGLWVWNMRQGSHASQLQSDRQDKVELLQADLSELERELQETRDRLDFADQLLKKKPPSN